MKRCKLFALLLAAALLLTGCGSRKSPAAEPMAYGVNMAQGKSEDYDVPYAYEEPTEEAATTAPAPEGAAGIADAENRYGEKIIYNAELTITADVPADSLENARRQCEALGGYLASSYEWTDSEGQNYASATLKVPADQLEAFVQSLERLGEAEHYRLWSDDVTLQYFDMSARLKAMQAEEAQLMQVLEECKTVEEILLVREQLAEVRERIESYQGRIRLWDHEVRYATLELTINETPKKAAETDRWSAAGVGGRILEGLENSWDYLLIILAGFVIVLANIGLPVLVIGGIVVGIVLLSRRASRKRKERRARKQLAAEQGKAEAEAAEQDAGTRENA